MLDLGKEIIVFFWYCRSYFVCFEIYFCLEWDCFLVLLFKWDMSFIYLFIYFYFFIMCFFSFFIFPIWMLRKVGNEKEKKISNFSHFLVLIFLELFCSRKTKNLLNDMEEKENELLGNSYLLKGFCRFFFSFSFEEDERRENDGCNM